VDAEAALRAATGPILVLLVALVARFLAASFLGTILVQVDRAILRRRRCQCWNWRRYRSRCRSWRGGRCIRQHLARPRRLILTRVVRVDAEAALRAATGPILVLLVALVARFLAASFLGTTLVQVDCAIFRIGGRGLRQQATPEDLIGVDPALDRLHTADVAEVRRQPLVVGLCTSKLLIHVVVEVPTRKELVQAALKILAVRQNVLVVIPALRSCPHVPDLHNPLRSPVPKCADIFRDAGRAACW